MYNLRNEIIKSFYPYNKPIFTGNHKITEGYTQCTVYLMYWGHFPRLIYDRSLSSYQSLIGYQKTLSERCDAFWPTFLYMAHSIVWHNLLPYLLIPFVDRLNHIYFQLELLANFPNYRQCWNLNSFSLLIYVLYDLLHRESFRAL